MWQYKGEVGRHLYTTKEFPNPMVNMVNFSMSYVVTPNLQGQEIFTKTSPEKLHTKIQYPDTRYDISLTFNTDRLKSIGRPDIDIVVNRITPGANITVPDANITKDEFEMLKPTLTGILLFLPPNLKIPFESGQFYSDTLTNYQIS